MLYLYTQDQPERYRQLLCEALPEIDIACWPQEVDTNAVTHAAVWSPPEGFFARFPRLQAVFALGAGVDKLLRHQELSPQVSLIRLTDTGMAQQMREYCLYGLLHYQRGMDITGSSKVPDAGFSTPPGWQAKSASAFSAWANWAIGLRMIWRIAAIVSPVGDVKRTRTKPSPASMA